MTFPEALPGLASHALIHLLIIGSLVRLAVTLVLRRPALSRLTPARPRARYVITVVGFLAAIVIPLATQLVGLRTLSETEAVRYDAVALAEASWWLGNSARWPLRPPTGGEFEAWWLWISIGPWSRDLLMIWVTGTLLLTVASAIGSWLFQKKQRQWVHVPDALRRALDFPPDVALLTGPVGTPLATGLWRPRVYLPHWSTADLEPAALARIARHELAHVRWRDPLVDRGVRILRGLLWPAWPLWSLARSIRREREAAADVEALAAESVSRESRQAVLDYAETLLTVAARRSGLIPLVGADGELEDRVRRLLQPRHSPVLATALLAVLLFAGAAALVVSPLPVGSAALLDFPHSREDIRGWGPLDHFLGFNPRVEQIVEPGGHRLRIQGHELDAEQIDRWRNAVSLAERAAIVLEAEDLARRAPPTN